MTVPVNPRVRGVGYAILALMVVAFVGVTYWVYRDLEYKRSKASCESNLQALGRALLAYEQKHRSLPAAYVQGKDGKPAYSWRVQILPFLGRQDLYDAYDFDEPWDSPNNRLLIDQMPDVFACPCGAGRATGKTSYVAVVGSQTVWPGARAMRSDYLAGRDGLSNTILLIEIANSDIGWTEPRDVRLNEIVPPDGDDVGTRFTSGHSGIVNILYCDTRVFSFPTSPPVEGARKVLFTLLTAARGRPYKGEWLPGEEVVPAADDFPAEKNADALHATDVTPHLADPIRTDRNYIYCATFQMAWDDFRGLVGVDPQLIGRPSLVTGLNGPAFPRSSLSPASYVARIGSVGIRDTIIAEMREKFPSVMPVLRDPEPLEFIAYAYLQKNLPFDARFDRISEPLVFHGGTGDAKVASFGFKELAGASSDTTKLEQQVEVLHYASDAEFILRLQPKTDEIVLAKIRPSVTLGETLRTVQTLIQTPPKRVDRPRLDNRDKLVVPCMAFNVMRRYGELIGTRLENSGKELWNIVDAKQAVRFLINENGARLESEAVLDAVWLAGGDPPPPPPPRHFVLDRPFLIYIKEQRAERPYLVMWIANAELMERRE